MHLKAQTGPSGATLTGMPTTYPRIMVTRKPNVDRIIAAGQARWPNEPPGAVLVRLAEQALDSPPRSAGLVQFSGGRRVTTSEVADLLDDE